MTSNENNPPENQSSQAESDSASDQSSRETIRAEIAERLEPLVDESSRDQAVEEVIAVIQGERFGGPLPHPEHLAAYENICPGAADRIIKMVESTLEHNVSVSTKAQDADSKYRQRGLTYGFISLVAVSGAALICALYDKPIIAGLFLATGVLGVIVKFVDGASFGLGSKKQEPTESKQEEQKTTD